MMQAHDKKSGTYPRGGCKRWTYTLLKGVPSHLRLLEGERRVVMILRTASFHRRPNTTQD